jgi:two-component system cell cycle sensor histidine kinase PleC
MRQIVLNLLSNSVKFTPAGGLITIETGLSEDGGLQIAVRDNGIGMAADDIVKALEPFGQVSDVLTRETGGTGLGLPLTVKLVELHGGKLSIESAPGNGTTVTLTFPADRTVRAALPQPSGEGVRACA